MVSLQQHPITVEDLPEKQREELREKNPLNHLKDSEKKLLEALKQEVSTWDLKDKERNYVDDMCCYRFLLGWKWNLQHALKHLKETCEFRAKHRPDMLNAKHILKSYQQGWLFEHGYDKEGHPVIYILLGKDKNPWDNEHNDLRFKNICYVMEQCANRMPEGIYNTTFVVDLKGATINLSLIKKYKNLFIRLGDVYCECLYRCVVMNSGFAFTTVWNFIKVFLAKSTVKKYVFVKSKKEAKSLEKVIDAQMMPKDATLAGGYGKYEFDFKKNLSTRMVIAAQLHAAAKEEEMPTGGIVDDFGGAEEQPGDDEVLRKAEEEAMQAEAENDDEKDDEPESA